MLKRIIKGDDGCKHAATCLDCPMPDCVVSEGIGGGAPRVTAEGKQQIAVWQREGMSTLAMSLRLGVGRRACSGTCHVASPNTRADREGRNDMAKQRFICPKCGERCSYLCDHEINGQTHELHQCSNYRCGLTSSPLKIRNGKKETVTP